MAFGLTIGTERAAALQVCLGFIYFRYVSNAHR